MTDSCITNFTQERLIKYPVSTYLYLHLKSRIYLYTVHLIYVLNPLLYRYVDNVNPITAFIPRPKKGSTGCSHGCGTKYWSLCLWQISIRKKCASYSGEDILLLRLRVIQGMFQRQWNLEQTTLIRGIPKEGKISVSWGNIERWGWSLACFIHQQC